MKTIISSLCALAVAGSAFAQGYQVVVTTKEGQKQVFNCDDVSKIRFEDTPNYIAADHFIGGTYNSSAESATYSFSIANNEPGNTGDPAAVGDIQLTLALVGPASAEAHNAQVPDGFYTVNMSNEQWTVNTEKSGMWMRVAEGDGEDAIANFFFLSGTVDVSHDGTNTALTATLSTFDGLSVSVSFYGEMRFTVGTGDYEDFTTDQNVTFTRSTGRVWANWFLPFADDGSMTMAAGKFDSEGYQTEGHRLNVAFNLPKDDSHTSSWNPVMPDGVYTINPREVVEMNSYLPYTLNIGQQIELWGVPAYTGTYLQYLSADGRIASGLVKSGTMTVSNNGRKFEYDFILDNGVKATGVYEGNPNLINYIDNSARPLLPTLKEDVVLEFPADAACFNFDLGDYIIEGIKTHTVMFTNTAMDKGDYVMLEIMEKEAGLPDGTYTINNSLENGTIIPGEVDYGGGSIFSWYGDLDTTTPDGYQEVLAPLVEGTLTISTTGGKRTFVFDMRDPSGKSVTGTWTGEVLDIDPSESAQAKARKIRDRVFKTIRPTWINHERDRERGMGAQTGILPVKKAK